MKAAWPEVRSDSEWYCSGMEGCSGKMFDKQEMGFNESNGSRVAIVTGREREIRVDGDDGALQ